MFCAAKRTTARRPPALNRTAGFWALWGALVSSSTPVCDAGSSLNVKSAPCSAPDTFSGTVTVSAPTSGRPRSMVTSLAAAVPPDSAMSPPGADMAMNTSPALSPSSAMVTVASVSAAARS